MRNCRIVFSLVFAFSAALACAAVFGAIRGLVHDPHHRPVAGAAVELRSATSEWKQTLQTDERGEFSFSALPMGDYVVAVSAAGFAPQEQRVTVVSNSISEPHFALSVAAISEKVEVSAAPLAVNPESSTSESVISRAQITKAPGADRSNSLAMITNFVPGAYLVHDQLHVRGGHQVEWLVDGVPVPNTNIASNVGPQFDPKDIDYVEVQRGGFSSEYGDRAYGAFNVVTRSGFERNRQGEVIASYGSYNSTNDQINFGSHTDRIAYYVSVNGNRSNYGLETPVPQTIHDLSSGFGGFTSLIYNATPSDQIRVVASGRHDFYQIPNDAQAHAAGVRDSDTEHDAFVNLSWVRTLNKNLLLTLSPFYHQNAALFEGSAQDLVFATDDRTSSYAGGQVTLAAMDSRNNARIGLLGYAQHDNQSFGVLDNSSAVSLSQRLDAAGDLTAFFLEDQFKATSWLTLNAGLRVTRFSGALTESAAYPRLGAALRVPKISWVLRGFYGRYYQPPPLSTVSGPLLALAATQGFSFLPLRGERDEQHEIGLTIPLKGWSLDVAHFRTGARNFFDHDVLGSSNIFFPLTLQQARIRGYELAVRSPRLWNRGDFHLAFSRQYVQGRGGITGGLTDFTPPQNGDYYYLDHDQRHTLSTGFTLDLPMRTWASGNLAYGSGFLDEDGPAHLPGHTTFDFSLGHNFGETWTATLTMLNVSDNRYLIDNSNTFGGTHWSEPRQAMVQVCYRFHY